jgi:hypothetical protein
MILGPCGRAFHKSPCMQNGKCSRFFPKKLQETTIIDRYPVYRKRNTWNIVLRSGVTLDNRIVVPYNPILLRKYKAHLTLNVQSKYFN